MGDNEEERQLFETRKEVVKNYIVYSLKEFEKAWKTAGEEENLGISNLWEDISPSMNTPETSNMAFDWDSETMLGLNYYDQEFSPMYKDFEEKGDNTNLLEPTSKALDELAMTEPEAIDCINPGRVNINMSQDSNIADSFMNEFGDFDILAISENDPDPPTDYAYTPATPSTSAASVVTAPSTINVDDVQSIGIHPSYVVKIEPDSPSQAKTRPRRKTAQTNRNVKDISVTLYTNENSVDLHSANNTQRLPSVKPALSNLNGDGMREGVSNSAVSPSDAVIVKTEPTLTPISACKSVKEERRKRKYEEDDETDPSVKNAKAAKMNRDKKKKQLEDLQMKVNQLEAEKAIIKEKQEASDAQHALELQQKDNEINQLRQHLLIAKQQMTANSAQGVKMLDHIQQIVNSATSLNGNRLPNVILSPRLAALPMPGFHEVEQIRAANRQQAASGLHNNDSLGPQYYYRR